MLRLTEIKLPLDHPESDLRLALLHKLQVQESQLIGFTVYRRAVDARKPSAISLSYSVDVELADEDAVLARFEHDPHVKRTPDMHYQFVAHADKKIVERPVVIGTGPCGLFAGLLLAQMGLRPIILERGKPVRERTKDTFDLWRKGELNPESNVQFGEGGAGTFSDGKLYSQIKDPKHYGRKVLTELVKAGAPEEILYLNKPHIGTFRLVGVVEKLRATIESLGGEIRFYSRVSDLEIDNGQLAGIMLANGEHIAVKHVVLAVGHSARDTFEMLHKRGVYLEAKPFSIGFRIEHPQSLIDRSRYGKHAGNPALGAADYKLVHHCRNGRSVYSFCMCPGGTVVAATSEIGRVVTNGMSQYSRNERNANSGIVVGITPEQDYPGHVLAGVTLQRDLEARAFQLGGENYSAPSQLLGDFLAARASTAFGSVLPSYTPGVQLSDLSGSLPDYAIEALREALPVFGKQIKGYDMQDALLTGVETRTSSPIRIKRDDSLQSLNTRGLYPAGEGAGYAGGILSAAVDGIKVAEAVARGD
jgi:uncharacterized FAD-dependent dehydrogenase